MNLNRAAFCIWSVSSVVHAALLITSAIKGDTETQHYAFIAGGVSTILANQSHQADKASND